jgi:hypothetical protein
MMREMSAMNRRTFSAILGLSPVVVLLLAATGRAGAGSEASATETVPPSVASPAAAPAGSSTSCPVTLPNGFAPPGLPSQPHGYGNDELWTQLWPDGRVVFARGVGFVEPDGSLSMKWPWWQGVSGQLTITGRRLDAPASPLRWIPDGRDNGFLATALIFPSAGCWEVTGRVGAASLTFVTLVVGPETAPPPLTAEVSTPVAAACPVTLPNGSVPPGELPNPLQHGTGMLWTELWPGGRAVVAMRGGQPLPIDWFWWRGEHGELTVEGHRLDAAAPPLQVDIPDVYGESGFQGTTLIFPSAGCWEVTGRVGAASLTFVTLVVVTEGSVADRVTGR